MSALRFGVAAFSAAGRGGTSWSGASVIRVLVRSQLASGVLRGSQVCRRPRGAC